jgi:ATP-dependent DNA helicase RecG
MASSIKSRLRRFHSLDIPVSHLKGVGPSRSRMLGEKGLHTVLDLIYFIPVNYEDRTCFIHIRNTEEGLPALVKG